MKIPANKQYGMSLTGLLMGAAVLGFAAIFGMKLIPAYMQDAEIKNLFDAVARDPEMQKAPIKDVRMSYIKRASVANVTAIKPDDIEISKDDGGVSLSASYSIKIPLAGNASLLLEFNPSSSN
ncbi:MAG: transmembrane protein [Gallionellaceae bacterium]|nr:MAG: transmembrane protein [Gallionellaceae bacterium]